LVVIVIFIKRILHFCGYAVGKETFFFTEDTRPWVTVTFDKNTDDETAIEAEPRTVTVRQGDSLGADRMPQNPTVESEGWNAGMSVSTWRTAPSGGTTFGRNTAVNSDITVYAQWGFNQTKAVIGDTMVVYGPELESGSGNHGTFDGSINDDKSMTWKSGGVRWKFPDEYRSEGKIEQGYDFVVIEYIGKNGNRESTQTTDIGSNILKQYTSSTDFPPIQINGINSNEKYPTLKTTGSIKYLLRDATDGGVAIQINNPPNERTMKFTKATFSRGTRHPITFDLDYPGAPAMESSFGIDGYSVYSLPYPETHKPGQQFKGWVDADDKDITVATVVHGELNLKATWETKVSISSISVDFSDTATGLTGTGGTVTKFSGADEGNGYSFTYSNRYNNSWAKFKVALPTGANLALFEKVTFEYLGAAGDTAYKPFVLLGATPLPSSLGADPHTGPYLVSNESQGSTYADWKEMELVIDKQKAVGLKGTVDFSIYVHSNDKNSDGVATAWKIRNVVFVPDSD